MFTLAHLSDPHLSPMPTPTRRELVGKRVTGYFNWQRKRRFVHDPAALRRVIGDVKTTAVEHITITGDFANIALPQEFENLRKWLPTLGPQYDLTVIPGNHDAYVRSADKIYLDRWQEYLAGDTPGTYPFPYLRRRGPVALIGLSSAVPTLPFFASGRIGSAQMDRFAVMLDELPCQQCFRIVLLHHPPAGKRPKLKKLDDAEDFRGVIARLGAEMILSGHDHIAAVNEIPGLTRPVPVVQVPSASAMPDDPRGGGAYNLYRIGGTPGRWTCEMETRGVTAIGGVQTLAKKDLL